mgnify:FL=1
MRQHLTPTEWLQAGAGAVLMFIVAYLSVIGWAILLGE